MEDFIVDSLSADFELLDTSSTESNNESETREKVQVVGQPANGRKLLSGVPNAITWEDVGGYDALKQELYRYIVRPIKHPEYYEGIDLPRGFMLYGKAGCGKTMIAKAVANEAGAKLIHVKCSEVAYCTQIRRLFTRAKSSAPCILFFDEVDMLTTGNEEVRWILSQLLVELDDVQQQPGVFVIGACRRTDEIERAVLRPGRLGKHFTVKAPDEDERGLILKALARNKSIDASVDLSEIGRARACKKFTGAHLAQLMNDAAMAAVEEKLSSTGRSSDDASLTWTIKKSHFDQAMTNAKYIKRKANTKGK